MNLFEQIENDAEAPGNARQRAGTMTELIAGSTSSSLGSMSFKVAIIGRPNVVKSTLFNRLAGRKLALVDDTPGVTRDRRVHAARLQDLRFDVIDTAGLEDAAASTLEGRMRAQTELAIDEADVTLFLIDAKAGLMPDDK